MSLLSDIEIKEQVATHKMIKPFTPETISRNGHLSYGLASSSYEVRMQSKFKLFTNSTCKVIDPLNFDERCCIDIDADELIIPPNGFALAVTLEEFNVPRDISILCVGKSTYARCGIIVNPTLIEAGVRGNIVLELSNTSPCPVKVMAGDNGVAKFMFFKTSPCEQMYNGNYQDQKTIVLPRNR